LNNSHSKPDLYLIAISPIPKAPNLTNTQMLS
jgi:hypothetical protein